ncbi:MAG: DUF1579 family protein [Planctomycetota bacterium]|jgi:hypothetical protein
MKTAAGVLIIIVALLDILSGFGYIAGGDWMSGFGQAGEALVDEAAVPGNPFAQGAREAAGEVKSMGGLWMLFGLLCLATGGLGIAAGVKLFQNKAAALVMAVGGAQIFVDLVSMISWGHVGYTNVFAIGVGAFIIYVGSTYLNRPQQGKTPEVHAPGIAPPPLPTMPTFPNKGKRRQAIIGAVAAAVAVLIIAALGIVLAIRTPDGTLIVEINESDAVVEVLDTQGNVEITQRCEGDTLSIPVEPGQHRLKIEKVGFAFFTQNFTIESGDTTKIRARLEPLPPELRALQRYIGSWDYQVVQKPTDENAQRKVMTGSGTWNWILEGRMIEQIVAWSPATTHGVTLMAYDAGIGQYKQWYFDSGGSMPRGENRGKWDEVSQTINWKAADKNGNTTEQVHRFIDKDRWDWTLIIKDRRREVVLDVEGKGKRKLSPASINVGEQVAKATPAEMKVLLRGVGTWQSEGVIKVAEGRPVEIRTTYTYEIIPILGGHFVRHRVCDEDGKAVAVIIQTFDPEQQQYRGWVFRSDGSTAESSGYWDEATSTLAMTGVGQRTTEISTTRFLDDRTAEWSLVSRDQHGKGLLNIQGKSIRLK